MAFRKPSNDAANRKYRRHSPVGGSSSSEGSQHHDRTSSPVLSKEDIARDSEHQSRRKDSGKETDGDDMKGYRGRNDGSYRNYEPKSSRTSHGYNRQDDRVKPEKHADDSNRNYDRFSSRSGRDMRVSNHSDYTRQESDQGRSRRYSLKEDRYSRDGYDASGHRNKDKDKESDKYKDRDSSFNRAGTVKRHTEEEMGKDWRRRDRDDRDERKSSEDHKSHRTESRGHRRDTSSARDNDKYRSKGEEKNWDELEACRDKDKKGGAPLEQIEKKSKFTSENEESPAKKPKRFSSADEKLVSEKVQEGGCSGTAVDVRSNVSEVTNDINAARIAAMKAAEQVNKNLVGVGFMTADQKKKLLWGNKKAAAPEETGNRWDAVTFGDRERQEKFNKLMSLRLPWCLWPIVGCKGRAEGGKQTGRSKWRWHPPNREAEGTSAGLGEAVYCRSQAKRWTHCWIRSLSFNVVLSYTTAAVFSNILLYLCSRILIPEIFYAYGVLGKVCLFDT